MHRRRHIQAALVRDGAHGGIARHVPLHGALKVGSKIDLRARGALTLRVVGHNGATCIDHVQPVDPKTQTRSLELLYGFSRIGWQHALHQFLDHGVGQAQQGDSAHHRPLGGLLHQRVGGTHQPLQAQHTALMQTLIQQHLQTGQGSNQCQREHHQGLASPRRRQRFGLQHHHGQLRSAAMPASPKMMHPAAC